MTLHTSAECVRFLATRTTSSSLKKNTDCNANSAKSGCTTKSTGKKIKIINNFGAGFNAPKKDGMYAMEWTATDITKSDTWVV
ncbi:putative endo-beta-glucanase [Erysiphe neolycopersici]|uniref:Putative endo-beta-glucanase n=1 Tax=Erysiphe neolycopersici TaxID=212602 RepID=A0A420I7S7_9PEZI|nr:putative endo-beta-glucanase [Erysiphe neolycopersici]